MDVLRVEVVLDRLLETAAELTGLSTNSAFASAYNGDGSCFVEFNVSRIP